MGEGVNDVLKTSKHHDLRTRIAVTLYQRDGFKVPWHEAAGFITRSYLATADAVIAQLNLQRQTIADTILNSEFNQKWQRIGPYAAGQFADAITQTLKDHKQ